MSSKFDMALSLVQGNYGTHATNNVVELIDAMVELARDDLEDCVESDTKLIQGGIRKLRELKGYIVGDERYVTVHDDNDPDSIQDGGYLS